MPIITINQLVNEYCQLRDRQYAVYTNCAKQYGLTTNELFVLDILWFSNNGCTQKEICDRLSANKQTIAAVIKRFLKKGYIVFEKGSTDRRNKPINFTETGRKYAQKIIPIAAKAENQAMEELGLKKALNLVKLTTTFTENMEKYFAKIKKN